MPPPGAAARASSRGPAAAAAGAARAGATHLPLRNRTCPPASATPSRPASAPTPTQRPPPRSPPRARAPLPPPAAARGRPAASAPAPPLLFQPLRLRDVTLPNRIVLSPMCMYSCAEGRGLPNSWHLVHLGARAAGGCGMVMAEATSVVPEGRISPNDTGIWNEEQAQAWKPIAEFIRSQGSVAAIQLAHAGRKAEPWGSGAQAAGLAAQIVGPSALPFSPASQTPREMTAADIAGVVEAFAEAARRAVRAGFQVVEIHMAHGYLLHQFLSPISNRRKDAYGGSLDNRMRLPLAVAVAVRAAMPPGLPLLVRISATDWGGPLDGPSWDVAQSVALCVRLRAEAGVDLVDVSSGGSLPRGVPVGPGYQVPFADRIRRESGVAVGAVGLITGAAQAEAVLQEGKADAIFIGRELLRDPHWPLRAAAELGYEGGGALYPRQYDRGRFPVAARL